MQGRGRGRGRPEEEVAEPVAGVAAGTEKKYTDAGEGPLRTGPNARAETNANEFVGECEFEGIVRCSAARWGFIQYHYFCDFCKRVVF